MIYEDSWNAVNATYDVAKLKTALDRVEGFGHKISDLSSLLSEQLERIYTAATTQTAKYVPPPDAVMKVQRQWRPGLRYQAPAISSATSKEMLDAATMVHKRTIAAMDMDKVL